MNQNVACLSRQPRQPVRNSFFFIFQRCWAGYHHDALQLAHSEGLRVRCGAHW